MVREEDEDVVAWTRLKHFLSFSCSRVALQNCQEVFRSDVSFGIVQLYAVIDIHSGVAVGRFVEDLALVGVGNTVGDVVVGESDDPLRIESIIDEHLV